MAGKVPLTMCTISLLICVAAAAPLAKKKVTYVLDKGWPRGIPQNASALSGVGVDPLAENGTEIYVSARGPDPIGPPILVFNEAGDLLRQWGMHDIKRNESCMPSFPGCKPDQTWGGHGLSVRPGANGRTQVWITDFYEFTVKVFDPSGG